MYRKRKEVSQIIKRGGLKCLEVMRICVPSPADLKLRRRLGINFQIQFDRVPGLQLMMKALQHQFQQKLLCAFMWPGFRTHDDCPCPKVPTANPSDTRCVHDMPSVSRERRECMCVPGHGQMTCRKLVGLARLLERSLSEFRCSVSGILKKLRVLRLVRFVH